MINFPLYVVRPYIRIFEEGKYKVIETHRNRYVLDYEESDIKEYSQRRLELLRDQNKPYELYHMKYILNTVSQVIASKSKLFMDASGSLMMWNPKEYKKVSCHRIITRWQTPSGSYAIKLNKIPTTFIVGNPNYDYAQVVKIGKSYILYDLCDEMRKFTRLKI